MSVGDSSTCPRDMMVSCLAQNPDGQEAADEVSFGVPNHQEQAESQHFSRPGELADGNYAQEHSVYPQVFISGSGNVVLDTQMHAANLVCFRPLPFTESDVQAHMTPGKVVPVSNVVEQPVWSAAVASGPDLRHLPADVTSELAGQHSAGVGHPPAPAPAPDLAPDPALQAVVPLEAMNPPPPPPQSHPETPRELTDLTWERQDHPAPTSDPSRAASILPQSRADVICTAGTAPGPAGDPPPTAASSCPAGVPPVPLLVTRASVAADAAPSLVGIGGGEEDWAASPPANRLPPAGSDIAGSVEATVKSERKPGAAVESLTIACDREVCSISTGTGTAPGPVQAATENDKTALTAVKAAAMVASVAAPSSSEDVTGAEDLAGAASDSAELPTIGSVLLSGDRLVFRCSLCPELFSSAGRLRTHRSRQHTPQPAPSETPAPVLPTPSAPLAGVRRRGRPPRSAAAAVTFPAADVGDDADDPAAEPEDAYAIGLRRTRSGRTRASSTPVSLRCETCGKVLSSPNKLAVHQRMHSGERPHVCTYCPKRCNDSGNLRKHEQLHFKPRPFRCVTCGITFRTALRQRAHRCKLAAAAAARHPAAAAASNGDEPGMADDGLEAAPGEADAAESEDEPVAEVGLPLGQGMGGLPALAAAAELAGALPPRSPSLEREPNVNSGLVPVVPADCDVCGRRLRSISGWQRHRRLHAGVRPYQCRFCDKACNDSGNMRKHEAGHFKARPYRCDTCCITFINAWRLGEHVCKLRADGGAAAGSSAAPVPAAGAAEVEVEAALESRPPLPVPPPRGRHAPAPQLDKNGRRRDHVCPVCNKALLSYASLEMHYRTHTGEKPYQCDECGKRFSIHGNLVVHTRTHTGERPFQCDECGKMFMYQSHLKVHKRGHSGARPYRCQFCQKGFAASSSKRVHEETVHSNVRKFICEACGAAFKEKKHLKRHSWKKHQLGRETAA